LLLNSLFFFVPLSYHFGILFTIRSFYKIFLVEIYCFTFFVQNAQLLAFYLVAHLIFSITVCDFSRSLFDIPYFFLCILPNILQNNFLNSENPVVRKEKVRNVSHFRCALSGFYSLFPCFCLISQQ